MSEDTAAHLCELIETLCDRIGHLCYLLEEGLR